MLKPHSEIAGEMELEPALYREDLPQQFLPFGHLSSFGEREPRRHVARMRLFVLVPGRLSTLEPAGPPAAAGLAMATRTPPCCGPRHRPQGLLEGYRWAGRNLHQL